MVSISTVARMVPLRHAEFLLRADEDVVPQPRFEMALHLGQIEVRAAAARQQFLRVVEKVEAEIEEGAGDGLAVDEDMPLRPGASRAGGRRATAILSLSLYCFAVAGSA